MDSPNYVKIGITSEADNSGFKSATSAGFDMAAALQKIQPSLKAALGAADSQARAVEADMRSAQREAAALDAQLRQLLQVRREQKAAAAEAQAGGVGALAGGIGAGLGYAAGGAALDALTEIPRVLKEAAAEGVKFNASMETSTFALAGMLRQYAGFQDLNSALEVSPKLMDALRQKANELGVDYGSMIETYMTSMGAMFHGGVTDLQKQVDLVAVLSQAAKGLGINGFMAQRDIQDLLMGMSDRTKFGRELGIKGADVDKAKEDGKLFEYLMDKLQGIAEAGKAASGTFEAEVQKITNQLDQMAGAASKPIFDVLKQGMTGLNETFASGHVADEIFAVATAIKSLIDTAGKHIDGDAVQTLLKIGKVAAMSFPGGIEIAGARGVWERYVQANSKDRQTQTGLGDAAQTNAVAVGKSAEQMEKEAIAADKVWQALEKANAAIDEGEKRSMSPSDRASYLSGEIANQRAKISDNLPEESTGSESVEDLQRQINTAQVTDAERMKMLADLTRLVELQREFTQAQTESAAAADRQQKAIEKSHQEFEKSEEKKEAQKQLQEETLQNLKDELALNTARAAGDDQKAKLMQIEINLQKELNRLKKEGIDDPEMEGLLRKNALMESQAVEQQAHQQAMQAWNAKPDTSAAKERGSGGHDDRAAAREAFVDAGGNPDAFDRAMRRAQGRFGGHAAMDDGSGNLTGPSNLRDSSTNIGAISGGFDTLKPLTPFGDDVNVSPTQPSGHRGDGTTTHGSDSAEEASQKLDDAATKSDSAASKLSDAADKMGDAASSLDQAATDMGSSVEQLQSSIANLAAQIDNINANNG